MIITIILLIILVIGIIWISIKWIKKLRNEYNLLMLRFNKLKVNNIRMQSILKNIELVRRKAKNEHKKIDSADNSDIANLLNDLLKD